MASVKKAVDYWHNVEIPREMMAREIRCQELQRKSEKLPTESNMTWEGLGFATWEKGGFFIK